LLGSSLYKFIYTKYYYIMRKTTSKAFRDAFSIEYPGLNYSLSYWRFMRYLIFGNKDEITQLPIIDLFHVARAEGKEPQLKNNHYVAEPFLLSFQSVVMTKETFSWSDWSYKQGKARIPYVEFPEQILTLIEEERIMVCKDKVYFDTGKKINATTLKVDRELIKQEALTYFDFAVPEAKPLLTYMNNLPVRSFSKVITANFDKAFLKALAIQDPVKKRVQIEVLLTLQEDLQPFYKPSERGCTDRIFPCNYSIPMLKREIRKELTKGWYEFDLASSQLAIVAKTWEIKEVQDFFSNGGKIWKELFAHYGFNQAELKKTDLKKHDAIKDILKTNLYSLIYGMLKYNIIKNVNEGFQQLGIQKAPNGGFLKGAGYRYFDNRMIKALYVAREAKLKELNQLDETTTIFGKKLLVTGSKNKKGNASKERQECIRSIMAHQAQSLELYILLPLVDLANTTNDFQITLWMHDGFSINFTNRTKVNYWIKKIESVINERIKEVNVQTYVEWEEL
jgi:hypothetical protein